MSWRTESFQMTGKEGNAMNVMKKITFRALKENRKRTAVTIIGIILATALITAVAGMAKSFRASMIAYEKGQCGDYHYKFSEVGTENLKYFENNRNIKKLGYVWEVGYAILEGSKNPDKPYLYICAMNEAGMEAAALKLTEGRFPENDSEILIPLHTYGNGGVKIEVGDVLELEVGCRSTEEGYSLHQSSPYHEEEEIFCPQEKKEYTVVGLVSRPVIEERWAPGYTAVTFLEDVTGLDKLDIYATYTSAALHDREQVTAGLLGISEELYHRWYESGGRVSEAEWEELTRVAGYVQSNIWLLKWELFLFSNRTMNALYAMAALACVIIIVASVFCIRNSFMISMTEKLRLFGMLSSVGATKKQCRRMVYYEALFFGIVGIPLGILSGVLATVVVIKVTSGLLVSAMGIKLVYAMSYPAMAIGAVLSALVVFFSAGKAARKAGKVSPISAIRSNTEVKVKKRERKAPKLIRKIFGIGGVIAFQNLRRARRKYRTTVLSIVVSVAIFIGLSATIRLGFVSASAYYDECDYQLLVDLYSDDHYAQAQRIAEMEGITKVTIIKGMYSFGVRQGDVKFSEEYLEKILTPDAASGEAILGIPVISLGRTGYENYVRELGLSPEEIGERAILFSHYEEYEYEDGRTKYMEGSSFDYHPGDIITGESKEELSFEIAMQTDKKPMGNNYGIGALIVNDDWMLKHMDYFQNSARVYIQCEDPDGLSAAIGEELGFSKFSIVNEAEEYEKTQSLFLLISIFLYGFITVIALIGITNIFNTITTNMELRSREFAMLKSVGMTGKEFRRMIWLESLFCGGKALIIGIPIGILLSAGFYRALDMRMDIPFRLPYESILISIAAVFLLFAAIMRYSMGKVNRKNIIQTIQNENI